MKEVVIDTNVLVSALLTSSSPPRTLLTKIASGKLGLVTSPRLIFEFVSVFARPKLRTLIPESRISDLVSLIHQSARIVKPTLKIHACRDPKDDMVLECALAAGEKLSAIISGDRDVLELNPFRGVSIVSPKEFLASLRFR